MQTLLLNPNSWDLMVTAGNNIAVASDPYSQAQDAASAIKLFEGEDYYDISRGIPYFTEILGHWPTIRVMKAHFVRAALTVPGVTSADCFIESIIDRRPKGQVQITNENSINSAVGF